MQLFLVQHGTAVDAETDPERPLDEAGWATTEAVAGLAKASGIAPHVIVHSGKARAQQTAEILALKLAPPEGVRGLEGLSPNDDVAPIAALCADVDTPLMLVGHLPFLSRLASTLIAGDADGEVVSFANAHVVCLSRDDDGWQLGEVIAPS